MTMMDVGGPGAVVEDLVRFAGGPVAFEEVGVQGGAGEVEDVVRGDGVEAGFGFGALGGFYKKIG